MTKITDAARKHLEDLAAGKVAARDKPSPLHHALLTGLLAECALLEEQLARAEAERVELIDLMDTMLAISRGPPIEFESTEYTVAADGTVTLEDGRKLVGLTPGDRITVPRAKPQRAEFHK